MLVRLTRRVLNLLIIDHRSLINSRSRRPSFTVTVNLAVNDRHWAYAGHPLVRDCQWTFALRVRVLARLLSSITGTLWINIIVVSVVSIYHHHTYFHNLALAVESLVESP